MRSFESSEATIVFGLQRSSTVPSPLIVTLELDERSFGLLDGLRQRYFRPERNRVPAHVTLFHQLPGQEEPAMSRALEDCCRAQPSFYLLASGLRKLGNGVAFELSSPTLTDIRD